MRAARLLVSASILSVCALAASACKTANSAKLKSEDGALAGGSGAPVTPLDDGKNPGIAAGVTSVTKGGEAALSVDELKGLVDGLAQTSSATMVAANISPASSTGMALADPKSQDVAQQIQQIQTSLAESRARLERLKELGDDSAERVELERSIGTMQSQMQQRQTDLGELRIKEQKQAEAAAKKKVDDEKKAQQKKEQDAIRAQQQQQQQAQEAAERERLAEQTRERERERERERLREEQRQRSAELDALIARLQERVKTSYGEACYVRAWTTTSTFQLNSEGAPPWGGYTVNFYAEKTIWTEVNGNPYLLGAGSNYSFSGGVASYILFKYPDSCKSNFNVSSLAGQYMGENTSGGFTWRMWGVLNSALQYNVYGGLNIVNSIAISRGS